MGGILFVKIKDMHIPMSTTSDKYQMDTLSPVTFKPIECTYLGSAILPLPSCMESWTVSTLDEMQRVKIEGTISIQAHIGNFYSVFCTRNNVNYLVCKGCIGKQGLIQFSLIKSAIAIDWYDGNQLIVWPFSNQSDAQSIQIVKNFKQD